MAEVGTYYITIMPEMSSFTKSVNTALGNSGTSGGKSFVGSFGDIVKGSALGTVLGQLAGKLGSTVASGFSTGINRLDTLKNFPRVMESFGYSADEASASVNKIMEHLRGLPTASQDVVSLTQAISDSTGDLNLASDAALGFNDMLLASGASSAEAATATGVLNRVLGKGSATTAQWQSLMAVMPKQLDMVAESMLGQGASAMDLYEALENGTFSYNDMLESIAKLDSEGTAGMDSFYEQAKANSIGIGSSIENIQNRIGAGWANVFDAIGQMEIHDLLEKVADGLKAPLDLLAEAITHIKEVVADTSIGENLGIIAKGIGDFMTQIGQEASPILQDFADKLIYFIDNALQWVVDHGDLVSSLLVSIGTALAFKEAFNTANTLMGVATGLKALGDALPLVSGLKDLPTAFQLAAEAGGPLSGVFSGLGGIFSWFAANPAVLIVGAIAAIVAGLVWFFTQTETGQQMWQDFCDFLSEVWTGLKEDWDEMCSNLQENWQEFQAFIDGIPAWWAGVCDYWRNQWAEFQTIMATSVQELKDNWNRSLDDIKNKAVSIFDNIRSAIKEKVDGARDAVHDAIERIKGFFNFTWSLPSLKLPHISISGSFSLNPPSVPSFGISWWANGNGVFAPNRPRIIGVGDNRTEREFLNTESQMRGLLTAAVRAGGGGSGGGVTVTGNTFVVREEADIDRISERLSVLWSRQMGGALA